MSAFKTALLFGQLIGATAFFLGFALCMLGLTGNIEILLEAHDVSAKIINGTPGVIFALFGFLIIWRYKPKSHSSVVEKKTIEGEYEVPDSSDSVGNRQGDETQPEVPSSADSKPFSSRDESIRTLRMLLSSDMVSEDSKKVFLEFLHESGNERSTGKKVTIWKSESSDNAMTSGDR